MKFFALTLLSTLGHRVSACGAGALRPYSPGQRTNVPPAGGHILRRQSPPLEVVTNQNNITHWTVDQNKRQMQVSDDAFNARDLARFNHAENITVYQGTGTQNLSEHLNGIALVYATTDLTLHNHDYSIWFGEGDWTVAVETITGPQNGPLNSLSGGYLPPSGKEVQYSLMTIARWNNGWMEEEYLWSDDALMYRQLGVLPSRPVPNLPDLELNLGNPLSTGNSSAASVAANKAAMTRSDDAINKGNFTAAALQLAPDAKIYGLSDTPLRPEGYIAWLEDMKTAFPDLRVENKPYRRLIGQGDWTATISLLSGTHEGDLTLPKYIAEKPVPATGKSFDLLHYTVARWQGGKIIGLRIYADLFDLAGALGVPL